MKQENINWGILEAGSWSLRDQSHEQQGVAKMQNKLIQEIFRTFLGKDLANINQEEFNGFQVDRSPRESGEPIVFYIGYKNKLIGNLYRVTEDPFRTSFQFVPASKL